ncbi:FG-GAP-like repeat-containing protein [Spongiactinospora sp. TRM90649]|uniref:FG-GAP-like repeat-containing protein n=1 Tax=Spongiactinospora sp. TRM90649 TaxID=3031114 RepID=UPI0023F679DA|nr:FG-GAP-like repeat-containing protein [Spongiactinospora sp. TRM90649]MDF5756365.1 FG-GAP-like repeat-containing protein [Spongiactinospora sp. TRM90649]
MIEQLRLSAPRSLLALALASLLVCVHLLSGATPARAVEGGFVVGGPADGNTVAQIWEEGPGGTPGHLGCSGIVTSAYRVMTAAHCVVNRDRHYYVLTGSKIKGQGKRSEVANRFFASETQGKQRVDLVILDLSHEADTKGVSFPKMPLNRMLAVRKQLMFMGWGSTCTGCDGSTQLKGLNTVVEDNNYRPGDVFGGGAYQIRGIDGKLHPGDSGGPSGYFTPAYVQIVTGVLSTGSYDPKDAHEEFTSIYDQPGCGKGDGPPCVYEWVKAVSGMQVYRPHDDLRRSIRAMPLGASSVYGQGSSHGNGFRDAFNEGLQRIAERDGEGLAKADTAKTADDKDDTPQVDMVGSVRVGRATDRDNEGWPGFVINAIAGKASCSVKHYQPNVVALMAGANDAIQDNDMGGAIDRLRALIEQIDRDAQDVMVLVAGVQRLADPARDARAKAFTAQIPGLVDRLVERGVNAVYVDVGGLEPSDMADAIHANDRGYEKIGAAFVKAAEHAGERGWIPNDVAEQGSVPDACGIQDDGPGGGDSKLGRHWEDHGVIQATQFPSSSRFWLTDVNKDRKAEFVVVDKDQNFRFWWNGGPSGNGWVPMVEGQNSYKPKAGAVGNQLRFGDVDGDDFPDCMVVDSRGGVVVSTWKGDNPAGARMCMDKEKFAGGAGVYSEGSEGMKPTIDPSFQIRFADVTGGGRDDYLVIEPNGATAAWYNQGLMVKDDRQFLKWDKPVQLANELAGAVQVRYADLNGDKRADRVVLDENLGVYAWINKGPKGLFDGWTELGYIANDPKVPVKDVQFADMDGDGKEDFVRIGWTGVAHVWLNRLPKEYFDTYHGRPPGL